MEDTQLREDISQKRFIEETYRIISTEGIEAISIRRLGREMQCNTANIYRYFKDLDELVTYASLRYLASYLSDISDCYEKSENTLQTHMLIWECFSKHSFANPRIFDNLFFGKHSRNLGEIIHSYYSMFPEELAQLNVPFQDIFTNGNFNHRDYLMISRCVEDGWLTTEDAKMLNAVCSHAFRGYLDELLSLSPNEEIVEKMRSSFIDCINRVINAFRLK